jgi:signal transduction histidine kinase
VPIGRGRIRPRLAILTAAVTTTVVLAFCIPLAFYVRNVAYDRAIDSAELQARSLAASLDGVNTSNQAARALAAANTAAVTPAVVVLSTGQWLGQPSRPAGGGLQLARQGHGVTVAAPGGARQVWEPVRGEGTAVAVMVAVPSRLLDKGVAHAWLLLFGGGALLVVLAVGLADRLGRRIVRPIQALEATARQLRDGHLERRVEPAGPYEVAEVGQAVNELAERIGLLLASAKLTAADLGHRLRTPLTAMRLDTEALPDTPAREQLLRDVDGLEEAVSRLIKDTRHTSRSMVSGADAATALRERMAFWEVLAESQARHIEVRTPARSVRVALQPDELAAAIDALVSNVFTHTPEGTGFRVELRPAPNRGVPNTWSLVVDDDGVGSADEDATTGSSATSRRGTGLGLDIVRRTAIKAGGTSTVGRNQHGGYRVELLVPEQPQPSRCNPSALSDPSSTNNRP